MLLMNGKKMSKSDDNSITPKELFTGESHHISKSYSAMVLRFFMLQSHYRSTLDLTDDALLAAEKGYRRLMEGVKVLTDLESTHKDGVAAQDKEINTLIDQAYADMADDFNTPKALSRLFELIPKINGWKDGHISLTEISKETLERLKKTFHIFLYEIFGLLDEDTSADGNGVVDGLMNLIIQLRQEAREKKDWGTSDVIRDSLKELQIQLKDGKEGTSWVKES